MTILSAVGALRGVLFITARVFINVMVFLILIRFFILLFPALAAPELLPPEFLVSELLFVLLAFLSSDHINALLASVNVWKFL